ATAVCGKSCRKTKSRVSCSGFRVQRETRESKREPGMPVHLRKLYLSAAAYRNTERLLMFCDPGLDAFANFRVRRSQVFDSVKAHSRKARFDARMRASEALFCK